jgi:hypothetical protein
MASCDFHIVQPGRYKVTYKSQLVGRIQQSDDGTYHVSDVRQSTSDKVYGTRDEAFFHFVSFNWQSVVGRSSLAIIDNRVIRKNTQTTQRWAVN